MIATKQKIHKKNRFLEPILTIAVVAVIPLCPFLGLMLAVEISDFIYWIGR